MVDLNGHTWTCTGTDANSAAFEINNPNASLTVKNGKVVSSQLVGLIPSAMSGTIKYDNSILTFENVEASTTATSGIETNGNNTNDTVVLKDSTLNVPNGFGIYFPSSGTLTIDNSTINAKTMGAQVCSGNLNVNSGSTITVSGDPVAKTEGDGAIQDGAAISIVNRAGYKGLGQIAITGGTFTAKDDNAAIKAYTWDSSTKQESAFDNSAKTVAVSGGTFSSAVSADLCAEGCTPIANTNGTHSVASGVAYVAGKGFDTLQAAIDAAQDGETVTLLTDATEDVAISKSITLDMGGKTLTNTNAGKATISVQGGTVTVKNGNVVGGIGYYNIEVTKDSNANLTLADVTATAGNTGSAMIDNYGTLTVTSGTYTGGLDTVKNEPNAKLTITGGAFTLTKGTSKGFTGVVFNYGDLTISGGEFIQSDKSAPYGQAQVVHTDKGGNAVPSTVISGGTFKNLCTRGTAWTVRETNAANGATRVSGGAFNKSITEGYCADGFIPTKNADGTYGVKEGHYVAQVGSKKYETLADAIRLAAKGKTITLLTDVEQNTQLTINKNITLDLNGKTIKNTQDIWGDNANAILSITNGAKVTITGDGTIDAKENDCYTINVVKGDLTIENGTFYGNVSVVQVEEGTLSVKGGTFDLHQKWEGSSKYLFNCIDDAYAGGSANVAISGGTFVGFDPSVSPEGEGTSYLAPGYAPAANADGTYGVKLAEGAYLLRDYRSGEQASWTYPTQDGMAFAGWYKDASFKTACTASDVEGAAYAKFVPITDLLQYKGGSLRMDVAQPSELTWLRFGYTMALPEGASYVENGWYFKKVSTSQPTDVRRSANNNVLNIDGTITANLVFTGVTTNYYSANFSEKAFVKYKTADGTTVEAAESDYQVNSVLGVADAILAHPMASEAEKYYATQIKAAV